MDDKGFINMIKKQILYIVPVVILIAGFVFLPFNKEAEFKTVDEIPEFVLQYEVNDTIKVLLPEDKNVNETILVTELLKRYHYNKVELNDSLSSVVFDSYLKSLDNSKLYFLKTDIDDFEEFRFQIDDFLQAGNLSAPYQIFAVFKERYYERLAHVNTLLLQGFDFTLDETFEFDRDGTSWAADVSELDETWRKYVKNEMLGLKLADKTHEEAVELLKKRYDRYSTMVQQYKSSDIYQVFMNSYTESYDPHTSYFNPTTAEEFEIRMSMSLEGIGARLMKDGDYTVVASVVPGGPAFKSDLIHDDDKIVGVGQDADGEIVDVVGWRNDDVVQLIRGKKGTTVRLKILEAEDGLNGTPKIISLVRDKINIEDARAESQVLEFLHEGSTYKIGVITVPSFYKDFKEANNGTEDYASTTRDVQDLLAKLQEQNIDGLMIDLRRNGGGALDEAIELTGLFIKDGPVVQVKDFMGKIQEEDDLSGTVFYDGPLCVLTSRASASASEIFSAAIQDYKRGLIVGEQTFGKGTVQQLIGLQRYIPKEKEKLGQLKLTMAKYYRVDGGSTQNVGVLPDIKLPSAFDSEEFGESAYPSALPWDKIRTSNYLPSNTITPNMLLTLNGKFQDRKLTDQDLKSLLQEVEEIKSNRQITEISLNEITRKAKQLADEEKRQTQNLLNDEMINTETGSKTISKLKLKDQYLQEGLLILADMVSFTDT